ncbi:MAG TPA: HAD-IIB family hydrolase [Prolixibacteraceae bacterium]|nr:HAD-IIB family hydrolase [Prolixibacteraceae bacterium]
MLKLVATDLDGTFLRNDKSISKENLDTLHTLGERGILRVAATGRNLQKTREVIAGHIPFDYFVFSSGAGVYDCRKEELLYYRNINKEIVRQISAFLIEKDLNFHLFKAVPDNHQCWYYRGSVYCSEFEAYSGYHRNHSEPLPEGEPLDVEACQFLVLFPNNFELFSKLKEELQALFPEVKVLRASSPLETGYIWMEIFHPAVSKGNGVKFLCDTLQIDHECTLGIGNDFNDLDLLEFTRYSYLVDNSPQELKDRFLRTRSNEESAFACAVGEHL